jgi:hypothetical protein
MSRKQTKLPYEEDIIEHCREQLVRGNLELAIWLALYHNPRIINAYWNKDQLSQHGRILRIMTEAHFYCYVGRSNTFGLYVHMYSDGTRHWRKHIGWKFGTEEIPPRYKHDLINVLIDIAEAYCPYIEWRKYYDERRLACRDC